MPNEFIGDVELTTINEVDPSKPTTVEELDVINLDDPVTIEHESGLEQLSISTALVKSLHTESADLEEQRDAVKSLVKKPAGRHSFDYLEWTGHLAVESVDLPWEADSQLLVNGSISARYLPYAEYKPGEQQDPKLIANDFNIDRPGLFVLPTFASNVNIRNPITDDTVGLTRKTTVSTSTGDLDVYSIFDYFDKSAFSLTNATISPETDLYGMEEVTLDASGERADITGITAPDGYYTVVARLRDDNVANDVKVRVYDGSSNSVSYTETLSTGGTSVTTVESSEFSLDEGTNYTIGIEKDTANSNTIELDGFYLKPAYFPKVEFDVKPGVDISNESTLNYTGESFNAVQRVSPVEVYDTNNSGTESDWNKVHNIDYAFDGDIVIQNGLIRYTLNDPSDGNIHLYWRDGSSWVDAGTISSYDGSNTNKSATSPFIHDMDSKMVEVGYVDADSYQTLTLYHGLPYGEFAVSGVNRLKLIRSDGTGGLDMGFAPQSVFYSSVEGADASQSSKVDNYLQGYDSAQDAVYFVSTGTNTGSQKFVNTGVEMGAIGLLSSNEYEVRIGASPFSSTSNLYTTGNSLSVTPGTDIPKGKYVAVSRASFSNTGDEWTLDAENTTDATAVDIDGNGVSKAVSESSSATYYQRELHFDSDDDGDTVTIDWTQNSGTGSITVDLIALFPVSLMYDSDALGIQEIAHESLTSINRTPVVVDR